MKITTARGDGLLVFRASDYYSVMPWIIIAQVGILLVFLTRFIFFVILHK